MRIPIIIGNKNFGTKKAAKEYYSAILNSYNFGESLNNLHYNDLIDLLQYYLTYTNKVDKPKEKTATEKKEKNNETDFFIQDVSIARFTFKTKCLEFVPSIGEPLIISYRVFVDKPKINERATFSKVCRNTIQADLIKVKQDYFKKRAKNFKAPCQESKKFLQFEDLVVDHRQPNTLSVIIDRFIKVKKIEYKSDLNKLSEFKNQELAKSFREYHTEKALLRVVDKNLNSSRSGLARLKPMKVDIKINY